MGATRKNLPVGDDRALFILSRGYCYKPGCEVEVVREVDGNFFTQVKRAHITAHSPDGPRYDPEMTDEERASWRNIILLCEPHHRIVDAKRNEVRFPVELLREWKSLREHETSRPPDILAAISNTDFNRLLVECFDPDDKMLRTAIESIGGIDERRDYVSYYSNEYGESMIFVVKRGYSHGTLLHRDLNWTPFTVDGPIRQIGDLVSPSMREIIMRVNPDGGMLSAFTIGDMEDGIILNFPEVAWLQACMLATGVGVVSHSPELES